MKMSLGYIGGLFNGEDGEIGKLLNRSVYAVAHRRGGHLGLKKYGVKNGNA